MSKRKRPDARSREWTPTLDVEKAGAISLAESVALSTPLVALSTLLAMPDADPRSRARVASGLLFAMNIVSWAGDWNGENTETIDASQGAKLTDRELLAIEEARAEAFAVGPSDMLGADAVQLVRVTQSSHTVALSGSVFKVRKLDELEGKLVQEGCHKLHAVFATWGTFDAAAQWLRADAEDLRAKGEEVQLPEGIDRRGFWVADEDDAVRARRNVFLLLVKLAEAWREVRRKEEAALAKAAEEEAKRRASYRADTATMLTPIARTLHAAMTLPVQTETVGLLEQIIIEAPGQTRPMAALALDWTGAWAGSLADHFVPEPMMAKVYACSLAESWDEGADDLSWIQNHERFAEKYFGTTSNRVIGAIAKMFAGLLRIRVLKAGKFVAPEGVGVPLIDGCAHEDDRKNPRYRHGMIVATALGMYGADERKRLGLDKQLVQIPRALLRVDNRLFAVGLGAALLVRDNLEGLRKRGEIALSLDAFFRALGRVAEARKRGVAAELLTAEKVFEQGRIGTRPVLRGDVVVFEPSPLLFTAYAQTMGNAARFEAASAKAAVKARRSAKK
jgi:hypothetical protein